MPQRNSEARERAKVVGSLEKRWELEGWGGRCWRKREKWETSREAGESAGLGSQESAQIKTECLCRVWQYSQIGGWIGEAKAETLGLPWWLSG